MAEVKIRKLDDWVVATHKARAEAAGRSLEEELRQMLTMMAEQPRAEMAKAFAAVRAQLRRKHGVLSDSTPHIRAERDRRR
ncbi:MAG: hypothetical protein IT561_15410 [Alphaproteobacteria bacterium]|nr:hypothetical protein [Alphaproteobacteria bacterium]